MLSGWWALVLVVAALGTLGVAAASVGLRAGARRVRSTRDDLDRHK
jgi:hypothetical protein